MKAKGIIFRHQKITPLAGLMKYFVFARHDYLVLICTVFPFMMVVCFLILGDRYFTMPRFLEATILAFAVGVFSWITHIITANILRELIPSYTRITMRILIQLPVYIVLTQAGIMLATLALFSWFNLLHYNITWHSYLPLLWAGLLLNVIATSFHEGVMFFEKWKVSLIETEQLKKMNLQSQLDGLKSQVNPHFLFNSLNCLSSLITTDPEKATEFLDEMSKVYRYLLRSNENELISVEAELQFISSFFHMLKTRYGDGIELEVNVTEEHLRHLIPPLSLQLLIENAVKHNTILKDQPLKIKIFSEGDNLLTVSNNIQKKVSKILSNKIGLRNIAAKYQLLNQAGIIVGTDPHIFSVSLPLIKHGAL